MSHLSDEMQILECDMLNLIDELDSESDFFKKLEIKRELQWKRNQLFCMQRILEEYEFKSHQQFAVS